MNILYLHRTQAKGVEGVHITETVKALTGLGHYVDIVAPSGISQTNKEDAVASNRIYSFISKFFPEICFESAGHGDACG